MYSDFSLKTNLGQRKTKRHLQTKKSIKLYILEDIIYKRTVPSQSLGRKRGLEENFTRILAAL